ncbi:hypothetical protein ABZ942_42310 [Nocardia sp. NPDC046473]|uniref:hypothetical protein n=1 Tax=Nocardia sp. NPDC046473 TaxID=3155733 RepID=UPI0033E4323D
MIDEKIARLVQENLLVVPNPLVQWNHELFWASVWESDPQRVRVSLMVPRDNADPFVQVLIAFEVTEEQPEVQAARIVASLQAPHPLKNAEVCAGDTAYAEQLGYT